MLQIMTSPGNYGLTILQCIKCIDEVSCEFKSFNSHSKAHQPVFLKVGYYVVLYTFEAFFLEGESIESGVNTVLFEKH